MPKRVTEKWHYKTGEKIYTNAVKYDNILCFESGNILYALNLQGDLEWKFTLYDGGVVNQNDEWDYYRSSPSIAGDTVYIGSEKGLVYGTRLRQEIKLSNVRLLQQISQSKQHLLFMIIKFISGIGMVFSTYMILHDGYGLELRYKNG